MKKFGQRPLIFYSNGYEHWLWDDTQHPPREVQGFYKKAELALTVHRRSARKALATETIDGAIVERFYQSRAIRRIAETFEVDKQRKALVVMATGAGKTRTVIALNDLLMRCNWAKRVLFLCDRTALVNQAVNAFKRHLPDASPVNLVTEKDAQGRVYVSTYPTMMNLIDEAKNGQRRFGVGHFDLVIIDEAHRSVYKKYRAIFDYFDALLVGLTATPKDEIDRDTYAIFNLERGVPTDAYTLQEAVKDGFLVPPQAVSVAVKIPRDGLRYDQLSEDERDQWDAVDWTDDGATPTEIEAEAVNKWLFNSDTVDKVLEHVMTRGQKVARGDRLGKTIIFAKNNDHAADSLGTRLFKTRLELIKTIDGRLESGVGHEPTPPSKDGDDHPPAVLTEKMVRDETAETLRQLVAAMNVDSFVVRPKRRLVEQFSAAEAWKVLGDDDHATLAKNVAALPTQKTDDDVEAKQFDLLMLRLQLALLRTEPGFEALRDQVRGIASLLEDKAAIPMVAAQMPLIDAMIGEEWWEDVTLPMLEVSRKRLRELVKFIDKTKRKIVYTNFEDQLGGDVVIDLPQLGAGADFERFRAKARQFLRTHEDHVAMQRLKRNVALTATDPAELERMLLESGVGSPDDIAHAKAEGKGLGGFIRALVGLDREAAKEALGQFVAGTTATANQVEFINLMVDYLTEHGVMDPALLYESPFTDISPLGPEGVFASDTIDALVATLAKIQQNAAA